MFASDCKMKPTPVAPTSAALLLACALQAAHCADLAKDQLLTPFAPQAPRKVLSLQSNSIDPNKPIWVSYSLMAVSASEKPSSELVLDASFEGISVPLSDSVISFVTDQMTSLPRTGTLGASLEAQVGKRSPEELEEVFGPELNAAYQALVAKKGAIFGKTIVKKYAPVGRKEVRLLASFTKSSSLQPVMLTVVIGQDDIPSESKDAFAQFSKGSSWNEKLIAAIIAFAAAALYLFRKFKR